MGLDHVSNGSCMNDTASAVFNNLKPINKDFKELERIYNHKDSSVTVGGTQKKQKARSKKTRSRKKEQDGKKNKNKKKNKKNRKGRTDLGESFFDPTSLPAVPSGLDSSGNGDRANARRWWHHGDVHHLGGGIAPQAWQPAPGTLPAMPLLSGVEPIAKEAATATTWIERREDVSPKQGLRGEPGRPVRGPDEQEIPY